MYCPIYVMYKTLIHIERLLQAFGHYIYTIRNISNQRIIWCIKLHFYTYRNMYYLCAFFTSLQSETFPMMYRKETFILGFNFWCSISFSNLIIYKLFSNENFCVCNKSFMDLWNLILKTKG